MNKIFRKLKEARQLLKETQAQMAENTGLSQRDISQLESGEKEFIPVSIIQYLNKKGIDVNSLYDDGVDKVQFWEQNIAPNSAPKVRPSEKNAENQTVTYASPGAIPLVAMDAFAGTGNSVFRIEEKDIKGMYVIPDFTKVDFMIRVKGNSMYPKYNSGDVVACRVLKERRFIQWNKVHIIATKEQGILIKRLKKGPDGHLTAVSENKEYEPFDVPLADIDGIAIVVGVIRLE